MEDFTELTEREERVLSQIIQDFIIQAHPVPSKQVLLRGKFKISSASIRNTMNTLEKKGFLDHIHTSSGRIPTDKAYRYYVNSLMNVSRLSKQEKLALREWSRITGGDHGETFRSASRLLSRLSNLLSIIIAPSYKKSVFKKLELIDIGGNKLLIVLTIESGVVKTVTIEADNPFTDNDLNAIASRLNERFSGLRLSEISSNIREVLSDVEERDTTGIIRVFIDSADDIFEDHALQRFYFGGAEYMAMQPEFSDLTQYRSIIELVENDDLIVHLFEEEMNDRNVKVRIGSENKLRQIDNCSVVSANYKIGNAVGTIGLVGPTRMNYPKMVALVEQLANRLNT